MPRGTPPKAKAEADAAPTKALQTLYAGLSHVSYSGVPFELGHGIILRSTYAHLFAANMMAFARASEENPIRHLGSTRVAGSATTLK
jgi:hypothetical protein